jgi:hypothetical protein
MARRSQDPPVADTEPENSAASPRFVPASPAPSGATEPHTETTRYLCAAAQVDEDFTAHVIKTVLDEPHRAVAPSYGVDLSAVARHAIAARRRRLARDALLLAILVAAVALAVRRLTGSDKLAAAEGVDADAVTAVLEALAPVALLLVPAFVVVLAEAAVTRMWALPRVRVDRFDPAEMQPRVGPRARRRLADLANWKDANVVVFSGFEPFLGSGHQFQSWSFAIDVTKGRKDPETGKAKPPRLFGANALQLHVDRALRDLGLPRMRVCERLFVNGLDVRRYPDLLPEKCAAPSPRVEPWVLEDAQMRTDSAARTYLCLEAIGWHGQLVFTLFFRVVRLQGSVYFEAASYALTPLRPEYYRAARIGQQRSFDRAAGACGAALRRTVPLLVASPVRVARTVRRLGAAGRRRRENDALISAGRAFNYGAATSIREEAMADEYHRFFLKRDIFMYTQVAQERLLRAIADFLEEHGVDTTAFAQQQTIINNNNTNHGMVMHGGTINNSGSFAGGANAQATAAGAAAPAAS